MKESDKLRLIDYLQHILQAIQRIEHYTEDLTDVAFLEDVRTQDAVIRNFEIIGEASMNIERRYSDFAANYPDMPWSIAYEMRNALAHGYFNVDLGIVWKTIRTDLPPLYTQVRVLINNLKDNAENR